MLTCKVCSGDLASSPDKVVLCAYKDGIVHLGCCKFKCSQEPNKNPCRHCKKIYAASNL